MIKVIIIGKSGVGKSSLLLRYTEDIYEEDQYPTVGLDVKMKNVSHDGKAYKL